MRAVRLLDRPIITPDLHPRIGCNIQAPSAIRIVPGRQRATSPAGKTPTTPPSRSQRSAWRIGALFRAEAPARS